MNTLFYNKQNWKRLVSKCAFKLFKICKFVFFYKSHDVVFFQYNFAFTPQSPSKGSHVMSRTPHCPSEFTSLQEVLPYVAHLFHSTMTLKKLVKTSRSRNEANFLFLKKYIHALQISTLEFFSKQVLFTL